MPPRITEIKQVFKTLASTQPERLESHLASVAPTDVVIQPGAGRSHRVGVFLRIPQPVSTTSPWLRQVERVQVLVMAPECMKNLLVEIVQGLGSLHHDSSPNPAAASETYLENVL